MDGTTTRSPTSGRRSRPGRRRSGSTTEVTASGAPRDSLAHSERHLHVLTRGRERTTLERWQAACPQLAGAPITTPAQVKAWLRHLPTAQADTVLGHLVHHAQRGDAAALLVVLVCLAPGIRALAGRTGTPTDEVVSEVTLGILSFPLDRRSSIAGGLLLDARNRLYRAARRAGRTEPLDETAHAVSSSGDLGIVTPAAQRIVQLVCQAHRQGLLDRTEARLILDTRLGGHRVKPVADVLGLTPSAAYQRRSRAEARLAQVA